MKQECYQRCPIAIFYNKWKSIRDNKEKSEIQERRRLLQEKKKKRGNEEVNLEHELESGDDDGDVDEDGDVDADGDGDEVEDSFVDDGGEDTELVYDDED